jgi:hypothetical protein
MKVSAPLSLPKMLSLEQVQSRSKRSLTVTVDQIILSAGKGYSRVDVGVCFAVAFVALFSPTPILNTMMGSRDERPLLPLFTPFRAFAPRTASGPSKR